ncbi:hypothetical protein [Fretibacter rubidus]|uniref:hypothetical protein n=1 Tax=Fretibacter rubidus TaxID=570162 RepID=UPI003529D484
MTKTMKLALLATAGAAIVAIPVSASHNNGGLRGMFSGHHLGGHGGAYAVQNACDPCAPTWQQKRLNQRLRAAPTFVTAQQSASGLRGFSQVGYAPQQRNTLGYVVQDYAIASPQTFGQQSLGQQYAQFNATQSYGGYGYNPQAAEAFKADLARNYSFGGATVKTNARYSDRMLDWQENTTGKALTILASRANGILEPNSLYLGGGVQGGFMYQKTDQPGQFPLLSRFPFFSPNTDLESGVFAINNAALSFTSTFGDWTSVYLQPEYSETEYGRFQDEFQLRKAYVVFGNLQKSPFYAAFGRKTIDFGNFDSYNAFTHNEGAHYFWSVSDQPVLEVGYYKNGFKLVGSALSGGRQLRVAFADEDNNIANYAVSAEKEFLIGNGGAFTVGGGYLHDTIYRDNFTAHTFGERSTTTPPTNLISGRNSAVNAFAEYNSPIFDLMVEYTTTLEPWGAAIPQTPDGTPFPQYLIDPTGSTTSFDNINFDQNLEVIVAQARIKPMVNGRRMAIAAVGSWGNISDDFGNPITGATFEKNQQHALSVEYPINDFLDIGAEYVYNKGFIPFVAPQLVSNDETEAHAVNVGFKARF